MRFWYGATLTDYIIDRGESDTAVFKPGADVQFWSAQVGGTQYTDLTDATGAAITSVQADQAGAISSRFRGPDGDPYGPAYMWASAAGGPRQLMLGDVADLVLTTASSLAAMDGRVTGSEENITALSGLVPIDYNVAAGAYPLRPAVALGMRGLWVGPTAPVAGGGYAEPRDLWAKTLT